MASDVQLKKNIRSALENSPEVIGWGEPRKELIQPDEDRKLGLTIRTFQVTYIAINSADKDATCKLNSQIQTPQKSMHQSLDHFRIIWDQVS